MKTTINYDEYKGNPIIVISYEVNGEPGRYPWSFGLSRAKQLLSALEQHPDFLEKFVKEHSEEQSCTN